jgi:signal transduction histidine kinase
VICYSVIAVVFSLFLVIVLSGFYFIRSIISPIKGIGERARQIAHGDFATRIEVDSRRKDEITALCNTINQMAGELASTEQMKNEFISSVSHELRTPLTAIKGWAETVMGSLEDPDLTRKGMEVIIGEAERLSVIVEDLLDFSRMQNGKLTYNMKPCDVVAEMQEAIISLSATAADQKILLDFTEPENVPIIIGDAGRLQQVFVNVVGNALKYTPEGGSIVVDIKPHETELEILVSDSGCGIDSEDLMYIKQKFYKGKDAARGSGIGLAIVDEIVSAHGGKLSISSTLHVGTTVTIFLPVQSVETPKQEEA